MGNHWITLNTQPGIDRTEWSIPLDSIRFDEILFAHAVKEGKISIRKDVCSKKYFKIGKNTLTYFSLHLPYAQLHVENTSSKQLHCKLQILVDPRYVDGIGNLNNYSIASFTQKYKDIKHELVKLGISLNEKYIFPRTIEINRTFPLPEAAIHTKQLAFLQVLKDNHLSNKVFVQGYSSSDKLNNDMKNDPACTLECSFQKTKHRGFKLKTYDKSAELSKKDHICITDELIRIEFLAEGEQIIASKLDIHTLSDLLQTNDEVISNTYATLFQKYIIANYQIWRDYCRDQTMQALKTAYTHYGKANHFMLTIETVADRCYGLLPVGSLQEMIDLDCFNSDNDYLQKAIQSKNLAKDKRSIDQKFQSHRLTHHELIGILFEAALAEPQTVELNYEII